MNPIRPRDEPLEPFEDGESGIDPRAASALLALTLLLARQAARETAQHAQQIDDRKPDCE